MPLILSGETGQIIMLQAFDDDVRSKTYFRKIQENIH